MALSDSLPQINLGVQGRTQGCSNKQDVKELESVEPVQSEDRIMVDIIPFRTTGSKTRANEEAPCRETDARSSVEAQSLPVAIVWHGKDAVFLPSPSRSLQCGVVDTHWGTAMGYDRAILKKPAGRSLSITGLDCSLIFSVICRHEFGQSQTERARCLQVVPKRSVDYGIN
ncbi:hypothetical protein TNCV_1843701 [Trichonephila clavipes]|nr:hypothetical protein TNCV_1843701 [Trichonephila clavipes]